MKELKAELKRGILHGKIIYVMMMVAILFALGWTENLSQAIEFRENANIVFSSIQHVLYVLYFDRFKAVMIAVLSLLCAGSVYEDISSGFFLFPAHTQIIHEDIEKSILFLLPQSSIFYNFYATV